MRYADSLLTATCIIELLLVIRKHNVVILYVVQMLQITGTTLKETKS